jgi:Helix-turn-helix domain
MTVNRRIARSDLLSMLRAPVADPDAARRHALRAALRSWRSRVAPAHVGLPSRNRRQPGLNAADVAELAGLSLCWYTQLERASPTHSCSSRAIDRVANALRLEDVDRAILQILANREIFNSLRTVLTAASESAG